MKKTIIEALQKREHTAGELKDLCGCDYPVLFAEISNLVDSHEIEHFMGGDPIALRYRLGVFRPASTWKLLPRQVDM